MLGADPVLDAEDAQAREDESLALEAIFGDAFSRAPPDPATGVQGAVSVCLPDACEPGHATLRAHFPPGYPSRVPPVIEIDWGRAGGAAGAPGGRRAEARREALERLAWDLEEEWRPGGDVTLFDWCQRVLDAWREACDAIDAELKEADERAAGGGAAEGEGRGEGAGGGAEGEWGRPQGQWRRGGAVGGGSASGVDGAGSSGGSVSPSEAIAMVSSEPVTIMRSTFQAHAARVRSPAEATAAVDALLASSAKIRAATHNVMAYRVRASTSTASSSSFACDWDDDGESAAGRRLAHLLAASDSEDVVLVVTRWYGGIHMGPLRFAVFANVGRALLEGAGLLGPERAADAKEGPKAGKGGKNAKAGKASKR